MQFVQVGPKLEHVGCQCSGDLCQLLFPHANPAFHQQESEFAEFAAQVLQEEDPLFLLQRAMEHGLPFDVLDSRLLVRRLPVCGVSDSTVIHLGLVKVMVKVKVKAMAAIVVAYAHVLGLGRFLELHQQCQISFCALGFVQHSHPMLRNQQFFP